MASLRVTNALPAALILCLAPCGFSLQQFGPTVSLGGGAYTEIVRLDVDRDGDLDLLGSTASGFGSLLFIENEGFGEYGTPQSLTPPEITFGEIALADVGGDGDLDVVVLESNGELGWYPNLGPSLFGPVQSIATFAGGEAELELHDLDADGRLDIVALSRLEQAVYVLRGTAGQGFGAPETVIDGFDFPIDFAIADCDQDGDPDVVVASRTLDRLAWVPNEGAAGFGTERLISSALDAPWLVAAADVDGDGIDDLMSLSSNDFEVAWYKGLGNGAFSRSILDVATGRDLRVGGIADIDLDGRLDVYCLAPPDAVGNLRWYRNDPVFGFEPARFGLGLANAFADVLAEDIDGDSDVDFLYSAGYSPQEQIQGSVFCTSPTNSTGSMAELAATGSDFAAQNALTLTATSVPPSSFGIFLTSQTAGMVMGPGGSAGVLCLGGDIGRYQRQGEIQPSGFFGRFRLTLDLTQLRQPSALVAATAGETWRFQGWYRDLVGGTQTSNFTEAVAVTFR